MTLLVSTDPKLQKFLQPLLEHVEGSLFEWCSDSSELSSDMLGKKKLKRLVLVITDVATKEVLERWQFDIETETDVKYVISTKTYKISKL